MTPKQWVKEVDDGVDGIEAFSVGTCHACDECNPEGVDEDVELEAEGVFSWASCDTCGCSLGGDRHPAHGWFEGSLVHFDVCTDCLLYFANGELSD